MRNLLLLDTLCALSLSQSCHISNFAAAEESGSTAAVLPILAIESNNYLRLGYNSLFIFLPISVNGFE